MELVEFNNPILRQKAKDVDKFSPELNILIDEMFQKLEGLEGVGLAAPQIGVSIQLTVIEYNRSDKDSADIPSIPKTVLINPKIVWKSKDTDIQTEACFSIPGKEYPVPRFKKIHLEYFDQTGKRHKIKAKGFLSRVIQHEIDHLAGKLICDYS